MSTFVKFMGHVEPKSIIVEDGHAKFSLRIRVGLEDREEIVKCFLRGGPSPEVKDGAFIYVDGDAEFSDDIRLNVGCIQTFAKAPAEWFDIPEPPEE